MSFLCLTNYQIRPQNIRNQYLGQFKQISACLVVFVHYKRFFLIRIQNERSQIKITVKVFLFGSSLASLSGTYFCNISQEGRNRTVSMKIKIEKNQQYSQQFCSQKPDIRSNQIIRSCKKIEKSMISQTKYQLNKKINKQQYIIFWASMKHNTILLFNLNSFGTQNNKNSLNRFTNYLKIPKQINKNHAQTHAIINILRYQITYMPTFLIFFHNQFVMDSQNPEKIGNKAKIQELLNNHYNNQLKQIFQVNYHCQCSKKYQSYSSLYFHVRQKHNVKLNAALSQPFAQVKIQDKNCDIIYHVAKIKQHQKTVYKELFYQNKRVLRSEEHIPDITDSQQQIQDSIGTAILGFIRNLKKKGLNNLSYEKMILQFFKKFITQEIKQRFPQAMSNKSSKLLKLTSCENLPTYFNQFLCGFFSEKKNVEQEFNLAIDVMFEFANWMRQNKLTSIVIEKNDSFKRQ